MEKAQQYYWRSKLMFMNNFVIDHHSSSSSPSSSWEEKAFAEDQHGGIGGCIWPPRSYSCSFCKREFRSAQALGGHMNVHRKDRARLKHSSPSSSPPPHHHHQHHYQTNDNHVCVFPDDDHHNHKSLLDSHHLQHHPNSTSNSLLSSPTSRVSMLSSYHYFVKQQKSCNDSSISKPEVVKNPREEASAICLSDKNDGNNNLFTSKKAKTELFTLSFLSKTCSNDRCGFQSEVPGLVSSSLEDVDLELRLGQPPKVN